VIWVATTSSSRSAAGNGHDGWFEIQVITAAVERHTVAPAPQR
jgi:hypothetical protein